MQAYGNIMKRLLSPYLSFRLIPTAGLKVYPEVTHMKDIEVPEYPKLKVVLKVPDPFPAFKNYRTQKKLRLMRGPELHHNTLLHKQYGVIATGGGRLKHSNFEMIRLMVVRNVDYNKVFGIWRVAEPWQAISKKGHGMRMGGGKASIDHFVTPVKAGQVIFELGGEVDYYEVEYLLKNIASRLPCKAMAVSQKIIEQMERKKKKLEEENLNPWTWKYIIQNNLLGSHKWISKYDRRWFNEYV